MAASASKILLNPFKKNREPRIVKPKKMYSYKMIYLTKEGDEKEWEYIYANDYSHLLAERQCLKRFNAVHILKLTVEPINDQ